MILRVEATASRYNAYLDMTFVRQVPSNSPAIVFDRIVAIVSRAYVDGHVWVQR